MTVVIYQGFLKPYQPGAQALQAPEASWLGS